MYEAAKYLFISERMGIKHVDNKLLIAYFFSEHSGIKPYIPRKLVVFRVLLESDCL